MPIALNCAGCGRAYKLREAAAGRSFRCRGCGKVFEVPKGPAESDENVLDGLNEPDLGEGEADPEPVSTPRRRPRTKTKSRRMPAVRRSPLTVANGLRCVLFGILLHLGSFVSALVPHGVLFALVLNLGATMMSLVGQILCLNAPRESGTRLLFCGVIGVQTCALGLRIASLVVPLSPRDLLLTLLFLGLFYLSVMASAAAFFLFVFALKRLAAFAGSAVGEMHAEWILRWGCVMFFLPQLVGSILALPELAVALRWIVPAVQLVLGVLILMRFIDLVGCLKNELRM